MFEGGKGMNHGLQSFYMWAEQLTARLYTKTAKKLQSFYMWAERDESRPYGSRHPVSKHENKYISKCQRVAMRQRRGVIHHVPLKQETISYMIYHVPPLYPSI